VRRALRILVTSSVLAAACVPPEPAAPIPPPRQEVAPPPALPPPAPALPPEPAPLARLPADVRPLQAALFLQIDPDTDRFSGTIEILVDLTRPRDVIWLHGKGIHARSATVRIEGSAAVSATYGEVDPSGVAALRLAQPVGPGRAVLRIDYDAPFLRTSEGLYLVERSGKRYAFTQFEAISARAAMPCFDEPASKIPYDVTLFVPKGMEAIANTREIERSYVQGDLTRISYATTPPLPSYLLAFAVGPLDIVNGPPIPANAVRKRELRLRGVAAAGRGKELQYALAHTGEMVTALETYLGIEYPYDKLDLLAVPDKAGAMENPGAVTFAEWLLLVDEATAPTQQKRAFWRITMHELAHMWFGDLVTMPWWDDLWLKEGFATWAAARLLAPLRPGEGLELAPVRAGHVAMETDSLLSARQVRQDVTRVDDIQNAFDDITYQKGAGVLAMFERWIGRDAFRVGVTSYLASHQNGTAAADDLFAALTVAAGRDVGAPFRSFVAQTGVPLVEAEIKCSAGSSYLALRQSRHLPMGSAGDPSRTWQIPICAKVPEGKTTQEACTLLTGAEGTLPLPTSKCPAWVMPNAEAAGYFVMSMPPADMKKLTTTAWKELTVAERLAVIHGLTSSLRRGTPAADVLPLLTPLATQPDRAVVQAVVEPFRTAKSWLAEPAERDAVEKAAQRVFRPAWKEVGWEPKKGKSEDEERRGLRADLLQAMALVARDPEVHKEAADRGRAYVGHGKDGALHPEVADRDLLSICLTAAAEDGDAAFFEHLVRLLDRATDDVIRGRLLGALGSFKAPELAARALALTFEPRVPLPFVLTIVDAQLHAPETRDAAWRWFEANVDRLAARRPSTRRGQLPWLGAAFCDRAHADALSRLFSERIETYDGGPRNLAGALEQIHLCAARRAVQEPSFRKVFKVPAPKPGLVGVIDPFGPAPAARPGDVADPWTRQKKPASPAAPAPSAAPQSGGVIDPFAQPNLRAPSPPPAPQSGGVIDPFAQPNRRAPPAPPQGPQSGGVIDPFAQPNRRAPSPPAPAPAPGVIDPWKTPNKK
jgi:cytosol alanyl aminopeptidase